MTTTPLETQVLGVLALCGGLLPQEQLDEMGQLVRAGEAGVALENLSTQLHEYDVAVGQGLIKEIELIGRAMGLDSKYWSRLRLNQLCQALGLQYEEQDWGIINADGRRLSEFIAYSDTNPLSETQSVELGGLILASANERLLSQEALPETFPAFLVRNGREFEVQLGYWRNLQDEAEFPLGNWLRSNFSETAT